MISEYSSRRREVNRERLYRHYLSTHRGTNVSEARIRIQEALPYFKRLSKYFPAAKDTRVLDLGCGYGNYLFWLKENGYNSLEGVDRSPEQVKTAHHLGLDFVKQGDLNVFLTKHKAESCDVILAFDVLEHFGKDEAVQFADEVLRVLVPGGLFILHLPNGEGFLSGCTVHGDLTHELILTRQSLGQLLRCVGFSHVSAYEDTPVVHGPLSAVRYLIWGFIRMALRLIYAAQTGDTGRELILSQSFLAIAHKSRRSGTDE